MKILYFGSLKTSFLKEGIDKYLKLIKPFTSLELINLPSGGDINRSSKEKILFEEEKRFFRFYADKYYFIVLTELGNIMSSEEFSVFLEKRMCLSKEVVFLVGGYLGISNSVKEKADFTLSLSRMTFTHEMAILLIAEQIYRSMKISKNQKYHY